MDAGQRGTPAVPAFRQHRRLLPLISFHPKGRQLKSLILAFVALGESLSCSNCQLSDRNQKMITRLPGSSSAERCGGQMLLAPRSGWDTGALCHRRVQRPPRPDRAGNLLAALPPRQRTGTPTRGLQHPPKNPFDPFFGVLFHQNVGFCPSKFNRLRSSVLLKISPNLNAYRLNSILVL